MSGKPDGVDPKSAESWEVDNLEEVQTNKIQLHNVEDLTVDGLRRLCGVYGTVVDAVKTNTPGTALVVFAKEIEAAHAVRQLNMKLGFHYNAVLMDPEATLPVITAVSPTDEDPGLPLTDEAWEQASVKRRFNVGFSLPLVINFPERESLATSVHYRAKDGRLARTDPELFFRIYKVQELVETPKTLDYDPVELQKRVADLEKDNANELNHFDGKVFTYRGLTEQDRTGFEVKYCVVCKGYGFASCECCGTSYCSVEHQQEHKEEHDRILRTQEGSPNDTPTESKDGADVKEAVVNVLTRDPLPKKLEVIITWILTPDRIYVRSAEAAADEKYIQTIGEFAYAGTVGKVSSKPPEVGDIRLAMYEPLGVYGRVLVADVRASKSKCVFIDYGLVMFVSNDTLLLITDPELLSREVFIYKACLTDITDEQGDREKAVQYLMDLKDTPLRMKYRLESNNIVDVQLETPEGESVNDMINQLIIIPPIKSVRDKSCVMYEDLYKSDPAVGKNKQIMVLNRTTLLLASGITWISADDLPYLQNLQAMVDCYGQKVAKFEQSYLPRVGEMCLVQCLERWYRGVCYETAGDGVPAIFLCDYGSMTLVDLRNVRQIPIQLALKVVRSHDGTVAHLAKAQADGLKVDSMLADIYFPENELVAVDISQKIGKETDTVLNFHEFDDFIKSSNSNL